MYVYNCASTTYICLNIIANNHLEPDIISNLYRQTMHKKSTHIHIHTYTHTPIHPSNHNHIPTHTVSRAYTSARRSPCTQALPGCTPSTPSTQPSVPGLPAPSPPYPGGEVQFPLMVGPNLHHLGRYSRTKRRRHPLGARPLFGWPVGCPRVTNVCRMPRPVREISAPTQPSSALVRMSAMAIRMIECNGDQDDSSNNLSCE